MNEINRLEQNFNMYYDAARKFLANNNLIEAKKAYTSAIKCLIERAKLLSGNQKQILLNKAKDLMDILESINAKINVANTKKISKTSTGGDGSKPNNNNDESGMSSTLDFLPINKDKVKEITLDDIKGLDEVKEEIMNKIILPLLQPEKYKRYGLTAGGTVLMYGPPGTGKTMLATAVANSCNAQFFHVKGTQLISKYVGDTGKHIQNLFASVRKHKPVVLFLDEVETLVKTRGLDKGSDSAIPTMLEELDGFGKTGLDGMMILAATNTPWDIDPAIMSRFDQVCLPLPNEKARSEIFELCFKKELDKSKDIDYSMFGRETDCFSGRDISKLCAAVRRKLASLEIQTNVIQKCTNKVVMDEISKWKTKVNSQEIAKFKEFYNNNNK